MYDEFIYPIGVAIVTLQRQNFNAFALSSSHLCLIARSRSLMVTPVRPWRSFHIAPGFPVALFVIVVVFVVVVGVDSSLLLLLLHVLVFFCCLLFHAWFASPPSRN